MLCDRIAVISNGRLSAPMPVGEASVETIGMLMGDAGFQASSATREKVPSVV